MVTGNGTIGQIIRDLLLVEVSDIIVTLKCGSEVTQSH